MENWNFIYVLNKYISVLDTKFSPNIQHNIKAMSDTACKTYLIIKVQIRRLLDVIKVKKEYLLFITCYYLKCCKMKTRFELLRKIVTVAILFSQLSLLMYLICSVFIVICLTCVPYYSYNFSIWNIHTRLLLWYYFLFLREYFWLKESCIFHVPKKFNCTWCKYYHDFKLFLQ